MNQRCSQSSLNQHYCCSCDSSSFIRLLDLFSLVYNALFKSSFCVRCDCFKSNQIKSFNSVVNLVVECGKSLWVGLFLLLAWQVLFSTFNIYLKSLKITQVVHDSQSTSLPFNQLSRSQINHSYISLLLASKPSAYFSINIYFRISMQSFLRFLAPLGKICEPISPWEIVHRPSEKNAPKLKCRI